MRRNFAQVLREGKIDIRKEYTKLYHLFYDPDERRKSYAEVVSDCMQSLPFCGTCLDLDEFDEKYGFHFEEQPQDFDIDYLVSFCEYIYNFAVYLKGIFIQLIDKIVDEIGYVRSSEDQFTIFVPKDNVAIAVSESGQIPQNLSYKIISYNHHSMKGDLQEKKNTILQLADLLEPKREALAAVDKTLSNDLFYLFNNLNLRHNNIDPALKGKYKRVVSEMPSEKLEQWYDETYQMCLLAFMQLEQAERKGKVDELKNKIESKQS